MAQVSIKTEKERDLSIVTFSGKVSAATVCDTLKRFYESEVTSKVLWDFSNCDVTELLAGDLDKVVDLAKQHAHLRIDGKSALVGPDDLAYGIGRMYATLTELNQLPIENKIFRNVDEALAWLKA